MRIALAQVPSSLNVRKNIDSAINLIREAKGNGADIIIFPECYLSSYTFPPRPLDISVLDPLKEVALSSSIGVLITMFTKREDCITDSAYLIGRDGNILISYDKVHTCDFSHEHVLKSGRDFKTAIFDGVSIGVMICYDREYPESARTLFLKGAEVILLSSDTGCMIPRNEEVKVAAMQNALYIASVNPPGKDKGLSAVYSPFAWEGDTLLSLSDELYSGLSYADLDIPRLRKWRRDEDVGKYRHVGAYSIRAVQS